MYRKPLHINTIMRDKIPNGLTMDVVKIDKARTMRKIVLTRNISISVVVYKFDRFWDSRNEISPSKMHVVATGTISPKSLNHSAPERQQQISVTDAITRSL